MTDQEQDTLQEQMRSAIKDKDGERLQKLFDSVNPFDFAHETEDLEDDELTECVNLLDDDRLRRTIEEADDDQRYRLSQPLDDHRMLNIFSQMQKDDIVDMLGDFQIGRRKRLINLMKSDDRKIINDLLKYPEDSAGGLMTTSYIALKGTLTVAQALEKLRGIAPKTEIIETIFITNDKRQLIGYCDLRDLLSANKSAYLSVLMHTKVISVQPETDQEETAKLVSNYNLNVIPVVSRSNQILGIVTVDDVIDVIIQEYDEDILQMGGVSKEENINTTLGESVKLRLPWLLVNLLTAFAASFTVSLFEGTIEKVVALSSVMTIISGMGGNAGTQTMSILVRQLAEDKLKFSECIKPFFKEILLGIVDGAACGLATALVVGVMNHSFFLGVISFLAMIGNLIVAGIFGFLVPLILDKLHADPAVSSSIFVTTATDVLGFFIFLGLATIFLKYLV